MSRGNELAVKTSTGNLARIDSIDAQFALFDRFHLARTMAETHRFVASGDEKHPFKLVKRAAPVRIFDDGEQTRVLAAVQMTQSERVGLNRGRGKYNDAGRLFEQDSASLTVGEVTPWHTI